MTTDEANAIRMDLSTEQCGLTHTWFTSSFNMTFQCKMPTVVLCILSISSLFKQKEALLKIQDMKVRMDDSCLMMFSFDIG